jgi:hypothetical protein
MKNLAADNEYLKMNLWQALEALYGHKDVEIFLIFFES